MCYNKCQCWDSKKNEEKRLSAGFGHDKSSLNRVMGATQSGVKWAGTRDSGARIWWSFAAKEELWRSFLEVFDCMFLNIFPSIRQVPSLGQPCSCNYSREPKLTTTWCYVDTTRWGFRVFLVFCFQLVNSVTRVLARAIGGEFVTANVFIDLKCSGALNSPFHTFTMKVTRRQLPNFTYIYVHICGCVIYKVFHY